MKILASEKLSSHKYKTPEGYLICTDAILARTGKQEYLKGELFTDCNDGESDERIDIDRPYDEVFNEKTMSSFENKPVTFDHPDEDVNTGNYKEYAVGYVRDVHQGKTENGEDVIMGNLVITDKDAIEAIENGDHTDLSCGYDCEIKDENGSYYQSNIRGNHVALCEEGRAGIARIVDSKVKDKFSNGALKDFKIESLINIVKERQEPTNSYRTDSQGNRYFIVVGGSFDTDLKTGENATLDVIGEDVNGKQKRLLSVYKASNWNEIIKKFNSWKNTIRDSVQDAPNKQITEITKILKDRVGLDCKYKSNSGKSIVYMCKIDFDILNKNNVFRCDDLFNDADKNRGFLNFQIRDTVLKYFAEEIESQLKGWLDNVDDVFFEDLKTDSSYKLKNGTFEGKLVVWLKEKLMKDSIKDYKINDTPSIQIKEIAYILKSRATLDCKYKSNDNDSITYTCKFDFDTLNWNDIIDSDKLYNDADKHNGFLEVNLYKKVLKDFAEELTYKLQEYCNVVNVKKAEFINLENKPKLKNDFINGILKVWVKDSLTQTNIKKYRKKIDTYQGKPIFETSPDSWEFLGATIEYDKKRDEYYVDLFNRFYYYRKDAFVEIYESYKNDVGDSKKVKNKDSKMSIDKTIKLIKLVSTRDKDSKNIKDAKLKEGMWFNDFVHESFITKVYEIIKMDDKEIILVEWWIENGKLQHDKPFKSHKGFIANPHITFNSKSDALNWLKKMSTFKPLHYRYKNVVQIDETETDWALRNFYGMKEYNVDLSKKDYPDKEDVEHYCDGVILKIQKQKFAIYCESWFLTDAVWGFEGGINDIKENMAKFKKDFAKKFPKLKYDEKKQRLIGTLKDLDAFFNTIGRHITGGLEKA